MCRIHRAQATLMSLLWLRVSMWDIGISSVLMVHLD
jgi:hypothetical protein